MSLHIEAKKGFIAEKILLTANPLGARVIAETWLERPICYNHTSGMLGFSGTYQGELVSVQGIGIGMTSIAVYVQELIEAYQAKAFVYLGGCAGLSPAMQLGDIILAQAVSSTSTMIHQKFADRLLPQSADFDLLVKAYKQAKLTFDTVTVGNIVTEDAYYPENSASLQELGRYGVLAADTETAALYYFAAKYQLSALALLAVERNLVADEKLPRGLPENTLVQLAKTGLDTLVAI